MFSNSKSEGKGSRKPHRLIGRYVTAHVTIPKKNGEILRWGDGWEEVMRKIWHTNGGNRDG
jgi:hypothetical protein